MPRLHALELLPDAAGESAVRRDWQALRDAGLPSMLDHTGASNTPHVTVVMAPALGPADEELAAELVAPLLPLPAGFSGLALLGARRVTVARLVDVPDPLVAAVLRLRAGTSGHRHPGWLPHVTLARRVERADVARVLDAVAVAPAPFSLVSLRRWDPESLTVHPVPGA